MAKKSNTTPQNATLARITRTEAYANKVRAMFAATINRILELNKSLPVIPDGEMYSFDAQTEKMRTEVERALRQLHSVATAAIESGIRLEWDAANAECDKLIQSTFGKSVLDSPQFTGWKKRNSDAMRAFIARSDAGMNLSERVWQSTRQLRDEMEIAITVAVGDGTSAARMSRNVRKYLNDPDLMFRRFRYKDPKTGEWKRKWKKRVIDPKTGKVTFIDYDKNSYHDQWTGRGYYKSAAMNAMRVARTETNIAYRRADNARWQQMDFVLGQRVQMSRSHPKKDICDKLAGDYPKDFVFDGWHPQCFCFVTPINLDADTMAEIMSHDDWQNELKRIADSRRITDYPDNFKSWVNENADNIAGARERGTEPYFIRNNAGVIDNILNPDAKPTPQTTPTSKSVEPEPARTPQEIADARHAARTPADVEKIEKAWRQKIIRDATLELARYDDSALGDAYIKSMRECRINGDLAGFQAEYDKLRKLLADMRKQYTSSLATTPEQITRFAEMEKVFGVKRGVPMTLREADMQSANPDYKPYSPTSINCQTCAPTYVLRSHGFNVVATGNTPGSVQEWISRSHSFDIWENADGTPAKPTLYRDWLDSKGGVKMTAKRYKEFYEEATKEPGIYITTIAWKGGGAHATIIQRFADGTLAYIEPQHYSGSMKRDIMELCNGGRAKVDSVRGIMRVDNKLLKRKCTHYGKEYDIWSIFGIK
nr:MAG TPA: Papain fold toxin 1, glutamine deamidase [Caudoviricetes sp.]